jgi:hypothetical protein
MRRQPIFMAFAIAATGAVVIGLRSGGPWPPIVVGVMLAAAMTGILGVVLQFLPQRLFMPLTILSGIAVGLLISVALYAFEVMGFGAAPRSTIVVWPIATIFALLISRRDGLRVSAIRTRKSSSHY